MDELKAAWQEALDAVCHEWDIPTSGITEQQLARLSNRLCPISTLLIRPSILIVSGPTGVGKSTLLRTLEETANSDPLLRDIRKFPNVFTREPRPGEREGIDLIHMTEAEFEEAERAGRFLQTNKRHGYRHGLLREEFVRAAGKDGTTNIYMDKSAPSTTDLVQKMVGWGSDFLRVYVLPPNFDTLWARITGRASSIGTSQHEDPEERVRTSIQELHEFGHRYNLFVINDQLDQIPALVRFILDHLCRA